MQRLLPLGASSALLATLAGAQVAAPIAGETPAATPFSFDATPFSFDATGVCALSTTTGGLEVEVSPRGLAGAPGGGAWAFSLYAYDVAAFGEATESAAGAPRQGFEGIAVQRDGFSETIRVAGSSAHLAWTIEPTADARGFLADELWLGLRVRGLEVTVEADENGATFDDRNGIARLALDGVEARDAAGTVLPTRLVDGRDGLGVRIDAANALYPITLEPTRAPAPREASAAGS